MVHFVLCDLEYGKVGSTTLTLALTLTLTMTM